MNEVSDNGDLNNGGAEGIRTPDPLNANLSAWVITWHFVARLERLH